MSGAAPSRWPNPETCSPCPAVHRHLKVIGRKTQKPCPISEQPHIRPHKPKTFRRWPHWPIRSMHPAPPVTNSIGPMCFREAHDQRRLEMSYSRRNFLKAAGSGVVLTAMGGESIFIAAAAPALLAPMTKEKGSFLINGKPHVAEYEARTTLWEVIAMQAGLTGTNRSCNRASCGACSVLVDGVPLYSCHTLATEASGKKILTIEGVGDEREPASAAAHRPHARRRGLRLLHRGLDCHRERAAGQESESVRRRRQRRAGRTHLPMRGLSGHHPHRDGFGRRAARRQDHDRIQTGIHHRNPPADGAGLFHQRRPPAGQ